MLDNIKYLPELKDGEKPFNINQELAKVECKVIIMLTFTLGLACIALLEHFLS